MNFNVLQTRSGRKNVTKKQLDEAPAGISAYDLLELNGEDMGHLPMEERRKNWGISFQIIILPQLNTFAHYQFRLVGRTGSAKTHLTQTTTAKRKMLKRKSSPYRCWT